MVFSSCFFSMFSFHGPELSSSHDLQISHPLGSALLSHLMQRLVYPNILGPRVTGRWVLGRPENTTVALYQRVATPLAFPKTVL